MTYRVAEPALAVGPARLLHRPAARGVWRAQPLDQVATLLAELAQQPALDLLARLPLAEALTTGIAPIRDAVSAALADDARLTETGVGVVSARVVAIRPEPELERALQTPTREAVQQAADRATYERRATRGRAGAGHRRERAAEQDRAGPARAAARRAARRQHPPPGRAGRRRSQLRRGAGRGRAGAGRRGGRGRGRNRRVKAEARADGRARVALRLAEAEGRPPAWPPTATCRPSVLQALALREFAGQLPEIGQLTVTPDVLTGLLSDSPLQRAVA